MTKEKRKIKPYPAIVPDELEPTDAEITLWAECMAGVVLFALAIIFVMMAGVAGYMWGMLR